MKKSFFIALIFILLILINNAYCSSKNKPILVLDPGGHTSLIWNLIVTKDKDIITCSPDKTIRVWSKNGYEKRKILGFIKNGAEGSIFSIALSPDEKYLAVGGILRYSNKGDYYAIRIYDYSTGTILKLLKAHKTTITSLSFSKDGKFLISGSMDKTAKIWDVKNNFKLYDTIKFHKKTVNDVKIFKNNDIYMAVTTSKDKKIALFDINNKTLLNSYTYKDGLRNIIIDDENIIVTPNVNKEILIFDLNLKLVKKIKTKAQVLDLKFSPDKKYIIVSNSNHEVNIFDKNFNSVNSFKKLKDSGLSTLQVGFLDNRTAVAAGGNQQEIYIWDIKTGKVLHKMGSVGTIIYNVVIKNNNIYLGKKFKFKNINSKAPLEKKFNLKDFSISKAESSYISGIKIKNGNYYLSVKPDYKTLLVKKDNKIISKIVKNQKNGYVHNGFGWYKDYIIDAGGKSALIAYDIKGKRVAIFSGHTADIWSISIDGDILASAGSDQIIRLWDLRKLGKTKKIYPFLNIFISTNDEYVVWTKSGYFASSPIGDKYIGYHINQGIDKEARFISSDKYFDVLYRPDIIKYTLAFQSEKKAVSYIKKTKRVNTINIAKSLPPLIRLLSKDNIETTLDKITIKYEIESKEPILETIVTLNGQKIDTRALIRKKNKNIRQISIDLENGLNIISIKAKNKYAFSDDVFVRINKKSSSSNIYKPTLYLLSVGVSKYENPKFNLAYADKDAEAIAEIFKNQKGKIFKDVKVKILTNDNADSDNVLDGLDWIDKEVTSKDVAIIFIAGHGINDDKGNYYFITYDANLDKLRRTAVKWIEIEDTVNNLPSKVILLVDTCHSGNITGSSRRDITGAIKSILNTSKGSIIMTATTGSGYSYENPKWKHGAFTLSIIEGLGNLKADYDNDGTITVKELDLFITNKVKQLTKGKQKPTTIIPMSIPDFALGVK